VLDLIISLIAFILLRDIAFIGYVQVITRIFIINKEFIGDKSKGVHRGTYGNLFNMIQIEINKTLRTQYFNETVEVLIKIVKIFHKEYN